MKLIIVTKRTTVHGFGGMETHAEAVGRAAADLGHDVVLITTAHPRGVVQDVTDGLRVEYLPGTPPGLDSRAWWTKSAEAVHQLCSRGLGDLVLSLSLAGYGVATSKVEMPHYAFAFGRTFAHLASQWHNSSGVKRLLAYPKDSLAVCYYAGLERRLWGRLDGIIATDDVLYHSLRRRGWRVFLSYNGTDPRQFRPDPSLREATRQTMGIPPDARVLVMVGTVNRQKGIWVGIEAFRQLAETWPSLHLVIVGTGPDRPRLEATIRGSPFVPRVHFVGAVPLAETAAYFAAADLLLYPTFRAEGLPNAIVQAMATGLPVLATDRGGIRTAVQHEDTGLLLSAPAVAPLAEALRGLLTDPASITSMGERAKERALASFDIRIQVARLLQELSHTTSN